MTEASPAVRLGDEVLVGRAALGADLVTISSLAGVVALTYLVAGGTGDPWIDLYVPLIALALGAAGAAYGSTDGVGSIRDPRYVAIYVAAIGAMMAVDFGVRAALGGDLPIVLANWATLIGSASAVNLLVTRVGLLSARRWIADSDISAFRPMVWILIILFQVAQAWISVLGASIGVVVVQLLGRRLAVLGVTHLVSRRSYGADGARMLAADETFEYVAICAVADAKGQVVEPDPTEQSVVGMLLLKLPIFAGESMAAGRKSLTRVVDKLLFVEQMLAFSSPTMVVHRACATGHTAFIRVMLSVDGDPAAKNPRLADPRHCKRMVLEALRGRWDVFRRQASRPTGRGGSSCAP